jgi:hypothetical protein
LTCQEIHEQITAYVDDRVDAQEYRKKIEQHIKYCPECRAAYEAELMTKLVVRESYNQKSASEELRRSITGGVDRLSEESRRKIESAPGRSERTWLDSFAQNYLSPVGIGIALVLVIAGGWFLYSGSGDTEQPFIVQEGAPAAVTDTTTSERAANFFNKASQNFKAILDKQLSLQLVTNDNNQLQQYFHDQGVDYNVVFAPVKAPLAGGVVSRHNGTELAHLVYSRGDTLIYVFEVPETLLQQGDIVYVTEDVLERINTGEQIWVEESSRQAQVMYKKGDVVLTVTGNVPRVVLYGLLSMG